MEVARDCQPARAACRWAGSCRGSTISALEQGVSAKPCHRQRGALCKAVDTGTGPLRSDGRGGEPQRAPEHFDPPGRACAAWGGGGGGGWHKASVSICLPLAAPIGLSPLLILTLCGPERVLVVSTEPPDDLSCLTTPGVGRPGDGAVARAVDRVHPDAHPKSMGRFADSSTDLCALGGGGF